MTINQSSKPYRKGVNAIIFDKNNKLLIIQKHIYKHNEWNFPGGGREEGETLEENLFREINEELSVNKDKFELIGISHHRMAYDYPAELALKINGGKYRGQAYDQVVLRFISKKKELIFNPKEFRAHMWVKVDELVNYLINPGQYQNYKIVIDNFLPGLTKKHLRAKRYY
jgi:putative (di)nucleoside polyphosphate hydrolase